MTEPNEELSTDELKAVSGGFEGVFPLPGGYKVGMERGRRPFDPRGSGSGMTLKDWNRANKRGFEIRADWDDEDRA